LNAATNHKAPQKTTTCLEKLPSKPIASSKPHFSPKPALRQVAGRSEHTTSDTHDIMPVTNSLIPSHPDLRISTAFLYSMTLRHSLASHHEIPRHFMISTHCISFLVPVVVASGHHGATFGGWRGAIWNSSNRFTSLAYQRHVREV
jgi:hypothetical protein